MDAAAYPFGLVDRRGLGTLGQVVVGGDGEQHNDRR
jgi:hypothetical protein